MLKSEIANKEFIQSSIQDKEFLSIKEIADAIGVTRQTILTWVNIGKIPANKVARTYFISRTDFQRFLNDSKVSVVQL